jgi:hypothetical protein
MVNICGSTARAIACAYLASMLSWGAQSLIQVGVPPQDVSGWGKTRWGMSESAVKRSVRGKWRPASREERDDDRNLYVPFVLQDVEMGGRKFIGLFGFSRAGQRLAAVTLHSGIPLIRTAEAWAFFERLADELQRELGQPAKLVRNNSGHTGFYEDYAIWRFPSSVIELTCIRPNDSERAIVLSYSRPSDADR